MSEPWVSRYANRCEHHERRVAKSRRFYVVWCKNPKAPDARERVGILGSELCVKHAAEREAEL